MGSKTEDRRPRFRRVKGTENSRVFWHPCSVCGDTVAGFGLDVEILRNNFGTWFCGECKPDDYYRGKRK